MGRFLRSTSGHRCAAHDDPAAGGFHARRCEFIAGLQPPTLRRGERADATGEVGAVHPGKRHAAARRLAALGPLRRCRRRGRAKGVTFDSLNFSIQAVIEGLGVAIAAGTLVDEDLAASRLAQPFGPVQRSGRPFFIVCTPDKLRNRRLRAFVDWLASSSTE